MKISAITAEYNPLHLGHLYHISETKKQSDCDYLIVAMSGDFTQRGDCALYNKYKRAQAAIYAGADLVLELPAVYATSSADRFALGSVSLFNRLGCVDTLSFGSESGDLSALEDSAATVINESTVASQKAIKLMKDGNSYRESMKQTSGVMYPSNDILALSYIKALKTIKSNIKPLIIKRIGGDYASKDESALSAASIRESILNGSVFKTENGTQISPTDTNAALNTISTNLSKKMPPESVELLLSSLILGDTVFNDSFSQNIYSVLTHLINNDTDLCEYLDVNKTIAGKIGSNINKYEGFDEFVSLLTTKDVIPSRIRRCLIHILLNIHTKDIKAYDEAGYTGYARVLAFSKESQELLSHIKKNTSIPLISKCADAKKALSPLYMKMLSTDIYAADIYEHATYFNKKLIGRPMLFTPESDVKHSPEVVMLRTK